jgi:hypothetical protein
MTTQTDPFHRITVPLEAVFSRVSESAIRAHIEEWWASVDAGESVTIVELLDYDSSLFPTDNPPVDAVFWILANSAPQGVKLITDTTPMRILCTS